MNSPMVYLFRREAKKGFLSNGPYLVRSTAGGFAGEFIQTTTLAAAKLIAHELASEAGGPITILKCTEAEVTEFIETPTPNTKLET